MNTGTLSGRGAIITGASQGLGLAIARAYVNAGAHILICARDDKRLRETARELGQLAGSGSKVIGLAADVRDEADVRCVVETARREFPRIDILVNNAGIHGPMGLIDEVDWEKWAQAVNVNLMGSVRFARTVVPYFRAQGYGKIIQVSGGGATNPLPRISAYAASKAAVVRFAESLALELKDFNIDVNSLAPGALNTRLFDEIMAAGPEKVGVDFFARSKKQREQGGTPLDVPAKLAVFLGSAASDGITGKLISAVWDDWASFPAHLSDLAASDVYTLRRIVAKDRGFGWGDK